MCVQQVLYLLRRPLFIHCSTETFIIVIFVIVEVGRNTSVGVHWLTFELLLCDFGDSQPQSVMRESYCPSSDIDMQEAYLCLHTLKGTTWRNVIPVYTPITCVLNQAFVTLKLMKVLCSWLEDNFGLELAGSLVVILVSLQFSLKKKFRLTADHSPGCESRMDSWYQFEYINVYFEFACIINSYT